MSDNLSHLSYKQTIDGYRKLFIKIYLLNFDFQTIEEISGVVIDGSINIDANADVRRSCNISLVVTDSSFDINPRGKNMAK